MQEENQEMIQLTSEHFKLFKEQLKLWLYVLGLNDYKVDVRFEKTEDDLGYAQTQGSFSQRKYWVSLSKEWENEWVHNTDVSVEEEIENIIIECAHHEAQECFYYRMRLVAEMRHISDHDVDDEIHGMIHRMEGAWNRFLEVKDRLKKVDNNNVYPFLPQSLLKEKENEN